MNHYQVNLRALDSTAPAGPLAALREFREGPAPARSPLTVLKGGLELLQDLGIELLHIMPPFRMGLEARKGIGSPYAMANCREIDPEFGTRNEWFALVRRAHALGMKVIMGFVPNHTARDHVWMTRDPAFYLRDAGGKATYDFDWSDTAKLNYTHPPLREEVTAVLLEWLQGEGDGSGVDGYRMDMAHMINDLSFWDECIPRLEAAMDGRPLLLMAECYGFERNLDLFRRGFQSAYDDDFYKILQYGYARDAHGRSRLCLDPRAADNGDFAPRLAAWRQGGIAAAVEHLVADCVTHCPQHWLARYTDNHDEGRGLHRFGAEATRVFLDLAACLPRTLLFTLAGQEAGALNRPPIHEYFGICDKGYRRADGGEVPGIEFQGNLFFRTSEARIQAISEARNRFHLRKNQPALRDGTWQPLAVGEVCADPERTVVAFVRETAGQRLACLFNLGHEPRQLRQPPSGRRIYGVEGHSELPPFATRILELES